MRATLEQLKAMSPVELHGRWAKGQFPFDSASGCTRCLTGHREYEGSTCHIEVHAHFRNEAHKFCQLFVGTRLERKDFLKQYIEEFYALRMFFDSLYPQAVEAAEEKTIAELAPSLVAQG